MEEERGWGVGGGRGRAKPGLGLLPAARLTGNSDAVKRQNPQGPPDALRVTAVPQAHRRRGPWSPSLGLGLAPPSGAAEARGRGHSPAGWERDLQLEAQGQLSECPPDAGAPG